MSLFDLLSANRGGAGGIGHKAATAALNKGYTQAEIAAEMGSDRVKSAQRAAGVSETNQNLMADLADTSIGNRFGGEHFGHADVAAARNIKDASGNRVHSEMDIENYIANTDNAYNEEAGGTAGHGYRQLMTNIVLGAGLERAGIQQQQQAQQMSQMSGQIGEWSNKYGNLKNEYDALSGKYDTAMKTAQAAKEEAMKIKYTGSTAVQNPSAMGIKAAQGKVIRGSGMAGAGALARPTKGQKIRTLNV